MFNRQGADPTGLGVKTKSDLSGIGNTGFAQKGDRSTLLSKVPKIEENSHGPSSGRKNVLSGQNPYSNGQLSQEALYCEL